MIISLPQAAQLVNKSVYTLADWTREKGLPVDRPGAFPHGWYVDTDDLKRVALEQLRAFQSRPCRPGPGRGHHGPAAPLMTFEERQNRTQCDQKRK